VGYCGLMPQGGVLKVSFPSKFPGGDHSNVFLQNGSGHVFWKMVLKSCRVWLILYHSKCVDSQRDQKRKESGEFGWCCYKASQKEG
jgi:hypothetical protein